MSFESPIILDISRSVSRADRAHPTGIDRVEASYLRHLSAMPAFAGVIVRVPGGVYFLNREQASGIAGGIFGGPSNLDLRAAVTPFRPRRVRLAEAQVRRSGQRLETGRLPGRFIYVNVGHSNQSVAMVAELRRHGCALVVSMLHDTIPADHPQWASPKSFRRFPDVLRAIGSADLVICPSDATRRRAGYWFGQWGVNPELMVAHLGTEPGLPLLRHPVAPPRFLALCTIEPRKNHALLLDVWKWFHANLAAADIPQLDIVGARGWRSEALFSRLAREGFVGDTVHEHGALPDEAVRGMLRDSTALLFPTLAEGFGLPLLEAAAAGLPVICSDLAVLRETGGTGPLYLPPNEPHKWAEAILDQKGLTGRNSLRGPVSGWQRHFDLVDGKIRELWGASGNKKLRQRIRWESAVN